MLQVQGRSDLFLKLEIIKKAVAVGPVLLGIFVGIKWMLWGSLVTSIFAYYLNSYYSGKMLNYSIWQQIKDILPSLGISLVMMGLVYAVSLINLLPIWVLLLQLLTGLITVISICELIKLEEYIEIKKILLGFIKR